MNGTREMNSSWFKQDVDSIGGKGGHARPGFEAGPFNSIKRRS
jgi:hypothetical protein